MLANCLFSRDPERPFDTERPRNWGSFGAELNGLKPWRRGGFRCFWEAVFFFGVFYTALFHAFARGMAYR